MAGPFDFNANPNAGRLRPSQLAGAYAGPPRPPAAPALAPVPAPVAVAPVPVAQEIVVQQPTDPCAQQQNRFHVPDWVWKATQIIGGALTIVPDLMSPPPTSPPPADASPDLKQAYRDTDAANAKA